MESDRDRHHHHRHRHHKRTRRHSSSTPASSSSKSAMTPPISTNYQIEKELIDDKPKLPNYYPAIQGCRRVDEYLCLNRIEEGTYGVVFRAKDKKSSLFLFYLFLFEIFCFI
jgi:cell division cycle 2-like protein